MIESSFLNDTTRAIYGESFSNLTSMFFPTGRPNIDLGVGSANLNLAAFGLI
jgi:hypothetical protein